MLMGHLVGPVISQLFGCCPITGRGISENEAFH